MSAERWAVTGGYDGVLRAEAEGVLPGVFPLDDGGLVVTVPSAVRGPAVSRAVAVEVVEVKSLPDVAHRVAVTVGRVEQIRRAGEDDIVHVDVTPAAGAEVVDGKAHRVADIRR